jgi:primosomal protein N'
LTPDTILVSPPYDGYEQILRVFAEASAKTRKSIISLERRDLAWINTLLSNNTTLIEWISKEYEVRKSMHLPPFETFLTITGYTTDKEYQKMWEFAHKESAYISLIPRLGSRIFGLDEKMTLQKSQPGRPFSLTFKVDASLFEERFFRSHKTTIVSRTKNPTYIEKEENLPRP